MRRYAAIHLISLLTLLALTLPAHAGLTWCKSDPVVSLDGTLVDITVGIPLEYAPLVKGPTRIEIQTPESVARRLIVSGPGFNGYPEEVVFTDRTGEVVDKRFPATIKVRVPIDKAELSPGEHVPVEVTVLPHNAPVPVVVEGTSDSTVVELTVSGQ